MSFVGKGDPPRGELKDILEEVPPDERGPRRRTDASNDTMGPYEVVQEHVTGTGMARTLRIDTAASPSLLLARARKAASQNGVKLIGNESSGRFSHKMLKGEYRRIGRTVIVTITYKHPLVPWAVLERRLRALFGGGSSRTPPVREKSIAPRARRSRGGRRASRKHTPHHRRRGPPSR